MSQVTAPPPVDMSEHKLDEIKSLVRKNTARWKMLILLEAVSLAVAAPLAYLWLVFLLDNWLYLSFALRLLASAIFFVGVGFLAFRLYKRWTQLHFSEDQVALAIEKHTPGGVQNRLINAIQIARESGVYDPTFSRAVIEENIDRLKQIELRQAAELKPALLRVGVALLVILLGALFLGFRTDQFKNAAARILNPFSATDPLYKTVLTVTPGNVMGGGDVTITVNIRGEHPGELTFMRTVGSEKASETIVVDKSKRTATYNFKNVQQTTAYAVRGGDFTSAWYRIEVPTPSLLSLIRLTWKYPEYTGLAEKQTESAGGDLESLYGAKATATFIFDQPADEASLIVQRVVSGGGARNASATSPTQPAAAGNAGGSQTAAGTAAAKAGSVGTVAPVNRQDGSVVRVPLKKLNSTQFTGEIVFKDVVGYQIETKHGQHQPHLSQPYALRVLADQPPQVELGGLEKQAEVSPDAIVPLKATANDDYGLDKVAIVYRKVTGATTPGSAPAAAPAPAPEEWLPLKEWQGERKIEFAGTFDFSVAATGASEGEKYEIVARATDTDPGKQGLWASGTTYTVLVGGEGVGLQIMYEQILRSEALIKALIEQQRGGVTKAGEWVNKLDVSSGMRWDDQKNIDLLTAAMKEQAKDQEAVRQQASRVASDMPAQAGSLRMSVGMLADTEMIRAIRMIEAVTNRENPQEMRKTLADARVTMERTIRSLMEVQEQYVKFRQDWETANMSPFVKMLADRQGRMKDESLKTLSMVGTASAEALAATAKSASKRELKVMELTGLAQSAIAGIPPRVQAIDPNLSKAYADAATALAAPPLKAAMQQASDYAGQGKWKEASDQQAIAAKALADIHEAIKKAQAESAKALLAALQQKAKSDVEAQKELEKLQKGSTDQFVKIDDVKIDDLIRMQEVKDRKSGAPGDAFVNTYTFDEKTQMGMLYAGKGVMQDSANFRLPTAPTPNISYPNNADRKANWVQPMVQEKLDDLAGKLMEEADLMQEKYETYTLNYEGGLNEFGDIGKQAGSINSAAAQAATGNQKPPPNNFGGASRSGRQGARSYGQVVGDESINRRGRDEAFQGQERAPDQAGSMKEKMSDDPQKDQSTGLGGKKVESEDATFNTKDAGHFDEDALKKMGDPKAVNKIVERQDGKVDPRIAEAMRDLNSNREQMIERIKAIKKELKNLYLPTEHLDELAAQLNSNLDALKEKPTPEAFRAVAQTLDQIKGAAMVFQNAGSGFQPSIKREQAVKGRVLDEPARQTIPGYEDAVKRYYQALATE